MGMPAMSEKTAERPPVTAAQRAYGSVIYWFTNVTAAGCMLGLMLGMLDIGGNFLNPHLVFSGILGGMSPDAVWHHAGEGFPGGHFYLGRFFSGDGLTQFAIVLGSSVALWALLAAAAGFIKGKSYGYAGACILVSAAIALAMAGVVNFK